MTITAAPVETLLDLLPGAHPGMDTDTGNCLVTAFAASAAHRIRHGQQNRTATLATLRDRLARIARRHPEARGPAATDYLLRTLNVAAAEMHWRAFTADDLH